MMWSSDKRRAGFSLLEALIVLAILSLTVAVFAIARPGPSSGMRQQARISDLIADAAQVRAQAIFQGKLQEFELPTQSCSEEPQVLTFFADGSAIEARICLSGEGGVNWLHLEPFTGLLARSETP